MRYIKTIFPLMLLGLLMCCCTKNNGGEQRLYGQWKLTMMEREGKEITDYHGNVFWSFQSSTIEIKEVLDHNAASRNFGNFRVADETLFIDFSYSDFMPPTVLGLPRQAELQIIKAEGGSLVLAYDSPATVYYFSRW